MKKLLLSFSILCVFVLSYAEDIDLTLQKNWQVENIPKIVKKPIFTRDSDGMLSINTKAPRVCYSAPAIKFKKGKMYKIEGTIESNSLIQIALHFYDAKGKEIHSDTFNCISGTDTELVEGIKGNETVLKVKDASKWKSSGRIVFNTKPDFSNILTSAVYVFRKGIKEIKKKKNYYEVVLKAPVGISYPAGTGIRQTQSVGNKVLLCNRHRFPVALIMLDTALKDEMSLSKVEPLKWWPPAKTVKLKIFQHGKGQLQLKMKEFFISEVNTNW